MIETRLSKDGLSRSATIRTATGEYVRPIQRLYRLEVGQMPQEGLTEERNSEEVAAIRVSEKSTEVVMTEVHETEAEGATEVTPTPYFTRAGRKITVPPRHR